MNKIKPSLTPKLRQNWWIDALLGLSAILAVLSSLYFLAFPVGGYQGGRNPYYQLVVVFSRHTWDLIHTWSGVGMIMIALWHIVIHWGWIMGTAKRVWQMISGKGKGFGMRLIYNILLDVAVAVSFLICAISGIYFLFFPNSGQTGQFLVFDKTAWDLIHTWSGVIMTITAILHFVLHWKWVVNITKKMLGRRQVLPPQALLTSELDQA
jgi:hypothetical protein